MSARPRIALICAPDGGMPEIVTDAPDLEAYSVDERAPDDRVYRLGAAVRRVSPAEFDALVAGPIHQLGDKPHAEQAARAIMNLDENGRPRLQTLKKEDAP